jgi:hypothetical protein
MGGELKMASKRYQGLMSQMVKSAVLTLCQPLSR